MTAINWTQTNSTRSGKMVRQSYTATDHQGNLLCREVLMTDEGIGVFNVPSYNEQPQGQSTSPGHDHCDNYAESMASVPSAAGGPTAGAWVLESQIQNGERTDQLWSNACTTGSLYLSIVLIQDKPPTYLTTSPGIVKIAHMALVYSA